MKLAKQFVRLLKSLGDVQVIPQKTRLVCVARVRFGGFYPRLRRRVKSPRIVRTVNYGPRWRELFVRIESAGNLDDELRAWLQESHDGVGMQK